MMLDDGEGQSSPESLCLIQHEMSTLITAIDSEFVRLKYLSTSFMCEKYGAIHSIKRQRESDERLMFILFC